MGESEAMARLEVFVGRWSVEMVLPNGPVVPRAEAVFEWTLGAAFLMQRNTIPILEAPDSMMIVRAEPDAGTYTQHYFDTRGVARLYTMTLEDGVWRLSRRAADFTPLNFHQRFTGSFSADAGTIRGAWELSHDGVTWEHDFALDYHRTD